MKTGVSDLSPASDHAASRTLPRGNKAPAAELFTTFTLNKGIQL
jgi:hypothetical protein